MKKFLLSSTVVILFALYVYKTFGNNPTIPAVEAPTNTATNSNTPTQQIVTSTPDDNTVEEKEGEDTDDDDKKPTSTNSTSTTPVATPTPKPTTTPTPIATVPATTQSIYKDGTFTGPVVDAFYGNIQVQVKIAAGKITDVIFLQYPNDQENSIKVNTRAMPILKSEIIAAQSANINGASGASFSSPATKKSVAGALALAKK